MGNNDNSDSGSLLTAASGRIVGFGGVLMAHCRSATLLMTVCLCPRCQAVSVISL